MLSDKTILVLGQNPSWGHWEQHVLWIQPNVKLGTPIEISISEPFEIRVGAGSSLNFCDTGLDFVCHLERHASFYHLGIPRKAHFILDEHATLTHKHIAHNPVVEASEVQIDLSQKEARVDWGDGISLKQEACYRQAIKIEHFAPCTHSTCCLKSIIQDKGNLNFVCDVFIRESASQSTAHQKNLNHVLSVQGHVTALPRLHIFNKAIEASHGTATQPIPQEALFYLQSRGLTRLQAEQVYLESFFQEFSLNPSGNDGR